MMILSFDWFDHDPIYVISKEQTIIYIMGSVPASWLIGLTTTTYYYHHNYWHPK